MKKIICTALALIMVLAMAGCTDNADNKDNPGIVSDSPSPDAADNATGTPNTDNTMDNDVNNNDDSLVDDVRDAVDDAADKTADAVRDTAEDVNRNAKNAAKAIR